MSASQRSHLVLLVEDNSADAFLVQTSVEFRELPLYITVADSGELALSLLEHGHSTNELPELLLLDLNMPRMNGFEVLEVLKSKPEYAGLPVVVLTTSVSPYERERALALGTSAYVVKPPTFLELLRVLEKIVTVLEGQADWSALS